MRVIIIGGVAAGMSAASKIKRLQPDTEVLVYEKGNFLSYGACGMPYYIGGFNDDYRKMLARSQADFEGMGIKTLLRHEVRSVNPERKKVTVKNLENGDCFEKSYDKLLVTCGASPIIPPFEGIEKLGVHTLKSLDDSIFLKEYAAMDSIKDVVVVGAGYIGIECAEAFLNLGKNVHVVEASDRILAPFDSEMSELAQMELQAKGAVLHLNEKVEAFLGGTSVESVRTDKGTYPAQLVLLAVGIRPSTGFLKETGIEMERNGAIVVDREMRTSLPYVYSAGDCAVSYNKAQDRNTYLALGTVANKCGRIAGENILGGHEKFGGTLSSAAIKVCDLELGRTGCGEEEAKALGLAAKSKIVRANDHAGYYPGATSITIKVIYEEKTRRLLGAQLCGAYGSGAVLRTDIFATAIQAGMTAPELGMTDLAYAPPFAGVWDAVQIACNAAK